MKTQSKIKLDIQPPTGIYSTYQRLTYTIWHAIAEFVDNSTASYYAHKSALNLIPNYKLKVYVIYHKAKSAKDCKLTILDNAYGMELKDFKRAIILNSPPIDKNGRNEFGMGLKTAASWFGNNWKIISTELKSKNLYNAEMDISKLAITNDKDIDITVESIEPSTHFTELTITNLNKKITEAKRTKVIAQLASIYRKDLREGKNEIRYIETSYDKNGKIQYSNNGQEFYLEKDKIPVLKYEVPAIWEYEDEKTGRKELYFKEFSDYIDFEEKKYWINGFIAIRDTGKRSEAGLTLIRRNRVIKGGPDDDNYRPKEIFGDSGSFPYQRVFGEVNMDNWPVTQAKNAFDWDNGLEEAFINKMNNIMKDYIEKSAELRVKEKVNTNLTSIKDVIKNTLSIENMFSNSNTDLIISSINSNIEIDYISSDKIQDDYKKLANFLVFKVANDDKKEIHISYIPNMEQDPNTWLEVKLIEKSDIPNIYKFDVILYYEHVFFKPYVNDGEFLLILKKFAIALAVSVISAQYFPPIAGMICPTNVLTLMNEYLKAVDKEVK